MKTAKEKAKEAFVILGDKYFNLLKETNPRGDFKHFIKMAVEYGFRHGYNTAFEWISVDNELPKDGTEILVKNTEWTDYMFYTSDDEDTIISEYTHWRPINND